MASEIPDFKDWTELKNKKKEINLPNGMSFLRFIFYVKYEPIEKFFEGICAFIYGKEIFRVWMSLDSSGTNYQKQVALLLEDGNWAVSLPIYREHDYSKFFNIIEDAFNHSVQMNILTESGWKNRVIKIV